MRVIRAYPLPCFEQFSVGVKLVHVVEKVLVDPSLDSWQL